MTIHSNFSFDLTGDKKTGFYLVPKEASLHSGEQGIKSYKKNPITSLLAKLHFLTTIHDGDGNKFFTRKKFIKKFEGNNPVKNLDDFLKGLIEPKNSDPHYSQKKALIDACDKGLMGEPDRTITIKTHNKLIYESKGAPNRDQFKAALENNLLDSKDLDDLMAEFDIIWPSAAMGGSSSTTPSSAAGAVNPQAVSSNHDQLRVAYEANPTVEDRKKLHIGVFNTTEQACINGYYDAAGNYTQLTHTPQPILYNDTLSIKAKRMPAQYTTTKISVASEDCVDACLRLKAQGHIVALEDLANAYSAGGGYRKGASAQEESICRRTNLYQHIDPEYNPNLKSQVPNYQRGSKAPFIPHMGAIYAPSVQIIRKGEADGFEFTRPVSINVIAHAAYNRNTNGRAGKVDVPTDQTGQIDEAAYKAGTREKIRACLRIAYENGNSAIVLGALGCGAFKGDPAVVSKLFKEVLAEQEFQGRFAEIVFAIKDDHNSKGNLATFQKEFSTV